MVKIRGLPKPSLYRGSDSLWTDNTLQLTLSSIRRYRCFHSETYIVKRYQQTEIMNVRQWKQCRLQLSSPRSIINGPTVWTYCLKLQYLFLYGVKILKFTRLLISKLIKWYNECLYVSQLLTQSTSRLHGLLWL